MEKVPYTTLKLVYEIIREIVKLENSFENGNDKKEKGYLIKKSIFDGTKRIIHYEEMKQYMSNKKKLEEHEKMIEKLKSKIGFKTLNYVTPSEFKDSKELKNNISEKNSEYYVINSNIGCKIFKNKNEDEHKNKQISFRITKEKIIIYFQNDSITFKNNFNNLGIIGKSNLIIPGKKEQIQNNFVNQKDNNNEEEDDE